MRGSKGVLIGAGVAVALVVPHCAGEAELGRWHFTVTAAGNSEFRNLYSFRSARACREQREAMLRGVARVLAEHGDRTVGRFARRLHIGPCRTGRRGG